MRFKPRPYQTDCVETVLRELHGNKAVLCELATGLGKTVIFSHIAARWPWRVLMLAHRSELVYASHEKAEAISGEKVGLEMGQAHCERNQKDNLFDRCRLVSGSVQSVVQRLHYYNPHECPWLIITDEAHRSAADTYRKIYEHFQQNQDCRFVGVTATPYRHDEIALGTIYDKVVYSYPINQAVEDGWLVEPRQTFMQVQGLDFSAIKPCSEFSQKDIDKVLQADGVMAELALGILKRADGKSSFAFWSSVDVARAATFLMNGVKAETSWWVDCDTDGEERKQWLEKFRSHQLQILNNFGIYTEGVDAPAARCVFMCRPTKVRSLYTQMVGRVLRPLPGIVDECEDTPAARKAAIAASGKPFGEIIDPVGVSGEHSILTAYDIFEGKGLPPLQIQYAKDLAEAEEKEGRTVNNADALRRAQLEMKLLEEERVRLEEIRRRNFYRHVDLDAVSVTEREVDPFRVGGSRAGSGGVGAREGATPKQISCLIWLGVPPEEAQRMTKKQAGVVIGKLKSQRGE